MAGAAELVTAGGWFANRVINTVADILRDNYRLLSSKDDMVENLTANGSLLKLVASAAERQLISQHVPNPNLKTWLYQLKEVLYKAEDVLDKIEYKKLCHKQQQGSKLISIPSSLKKLKNMIKIDDEIRELKDVLVKLDAMAQKKSFFSDLLKLNAQLMIGETSEIFPEIDKPVIGLERELELIVNRLLAEDNDKLDAIENNKMANYHGKSELKVLCITGFAGVGKTALAQLVYNDQRVQHEFGLKLWVHVREISDARHVMNEIMTQTGCGSPKEHENLFHLQKELQKVLRGHKFLLVLYGIRSVVPKQWRALQVALKNGVDGSAILVTARNRVAADTLVARESQIIVDFLDEVNCRRLFEKCAIGGKKLPRGKLEELRDIGGTICQQLHGLPSAVKILGRILNSHLEAECWKVILSGHWWEHEKLAVEVLPSLLSNYQDLPPDIQQCFAYCSIFPKNYIFDQDRLVQMWIAQGYIQPIQNKRLEDIGQKWFEDLTDRFFFKRKGKDKFVMHDRVRDLAVYVSRDECFVVEHTSVRPPQTVRHLTITTNDTAVFNNVCFRDLRTILIFGKFESTKFYYCIRKVLEESKRLRVFVTHSGLPSQSLSKANGGLLHLRYLGISSNKGNQLPGSVCQLLHLQVLDLGDDNYNNLPEGMKNLINLRHLYANVRIVSLISGIGNLTCLQELENFQVGLKDGRKIKELNGMNELSGRLCISNLGHVASKEEALQANLINKIHLETLQLRDDIKEETLQGLQPCPNLSRLEIINYAGKIFPNWMIESWSHFTNLQSIHLNGHENLIKLPPLGQIKKLKFLILENLGLIKLGDELYGELGDAFPSLKGLTLARSSRLTQWEDWSGVRGRKFFPVLQELQIIDCKDLNSVPNLSLISSLEELRIQKCDSLSSPTHEFIDNLDSLRVAEISDNRHIESLYLPKHTALERLTLLRCENLKVPNGFQNLDNLRMLHVSGCPGIKFSAMPKSELPSLTYLFTDHHLFSKYGGKNLTHTMPSLQTLKFDGYQLHGITSEQDMWFEQLTSLQELKFFCCMKLERLPAKLASCSSLKKLIIHSCQKIKSLPDTGLPYSLEELQIKQCPILGQRCQKTVGIDWPKISRIPSIFVDDITIQKL